MAGIAAPRGTQDILPPQSGRKEWLLQTHAEVAALHGFDLIETPIYEATELFERGTGVGTDVVDKEMFTFQDRGGRSLTLRPEGTPGTLRAVLSAHLEQERKPIRVHYAGPMFRHDRPQAGRYHQFTQLGIEIIAESHPALDVETIEVAWRFFQALGIQGINLQVNTLGDARDRLTYRQALLDYYTPLQAELCEDCRRRLGINPLRLLDCKRDVRFFEAAPVISASLSEPSRHFFEQVQSGLSQAEIPFTVNSRIVRGLDYYGHTTFEFWHESLQGAQNALGGGGRYDGLAEVLGFSATPGVGYSLGVERILAVCEQQNLGPDSAPRRIFVLSLGDDAQALAGEIARELRAHGIAAVLDAGAAKLDKKLRFAERGVAAAVVIVGEDEVRERKATLRDMQTRSQKSVPVDGIASAAAELLSPKPGPA